VSLDLTRIRAQLAALSRRLRSVNYRRPLVLVQRLWQRVVARPVVALALTLAVLASTGGVLLAAGVFDVRHVTVVGAGRTTSARVDTMAKTVVGNSMLTVNTAALRKRVSALPQVADVHVVRVWPDTLRVTIAERRPTFAVQQGDRWVLIDQAAVPYLTVARVPAHVLPLDTVDVTSGNPTVRAAIAVVSSLPASVRKNVTAMVAPSVAGIRLRLRGGATVVWGGPQDSTRKARALAVLLPRHARVYDVSTPGFVTTS
jgi:cell division protein FtsQ